MRPPRRVSASGQFIHQEAIVESLDHVRVTGTLGSASPDLHVGGGIGTLVGRFGRPELGSARADRTALYVAGAVGFHLRLGDRSRTASSRSG